MVRGTNYRVTAMEMSRLTVCVYLSGLSSAFVKRLLTKYSHFSGVKWIEANTDDQGKLLESESDLSSKLQTSDVVISNSFLLEKHFDDLKRVKWVHSAFAGVKEIINGPPPSFILTRQVGVYGILIAEYTISQIINRERNFFQFSQNQRDGKWVTPTTKQSMVRISPSLTVGILGVGEIGTKVAELCKAFGMTVWGLTKTTPTKKCSHVDHHRCCDRLEELLSNCDYVCNILPSTPETVGLLNGDVLKACSRKKSVLINVGRGDVVSEAVLVKAIREEWLSGAILDVFEKEPLPTDSELWSMPEVTITPHIAGPATLDDLVDVFAENLQLFLEGKQLKHVVDCKKGY